MFQWTEAPPTAQLPCNVQLGFLRDGRLRVCTPFEVLLTEQEGQVVAEVEELNEFGIGDNQTEAVTELQYAIADLYFTLEEEQTRLGKDLQRVWEILQAKIEKR